MAVTKLEKAFAEAAKLPKEQQEALAVLILERNSRRGRKGESLDRSARLPEECAKLDSVEERAMAEEGPWK